MKVMGRSSRGRNRRGLTLVECMVALMILPLAVAAVAYAVVAGQAQAAEALRQMHAATLAESLMEEILALPYEDPDGPSALGPEGGESTRAAFDNADDFHGFTEAAGNLADATGTPYGTPMQRFSRSVTCATATRTVTGLGLATAGLDVTVTVSEDGNTVLAATRFMVDPS